MIKGKSRITKYGGSVVVRIPVQIAVDEAWPFKLEEEVALSIVEGCLVVEKVKTQ